MYETTCGTYGIRTRGLLRDRQAMLGLYTKVPIAGDVSILVGQPPIGFHQLMNPLFFNVFGTYGFSPPKSLLLTSLIE